VKKMNKYEWSRREFKGTSVFGCLDCPNTFMGPGRESSIIRHCERTNHGVMRDQNMTVDEYVLQQIKSAEPMNKNIALCYLCWNTAAVSAEGAVGLIHEAVRLRALGNRVRVIVFDNGSQDATTPAVHSNVIREFDTLPDFLELRTVPNNLGISRARNVMIEHVIYPAGFNADYILLLDGDIQVVPLSVYTMARYLNCHPTVGCIGAYSSNWTANPDHSCKMFTEIRESRVRDNIDCAWTQYGLFRASIFRDGGIRFDESGPFGNPGWGFEDDDLCFQMLQQGWLNKYFGDMCYLHRAIRSSWPSIERLGLDMSQVFNERKRYLISKWNSRGLKTGIINKLRSQRMPERTPAKALSRSVKV
jgi:glycosyltransferase involved in cell wall biosynthesis